MKNRRAVFAFVTLAAMIMMMIGLSAVQIQAASTVPGEGCPVVGDVCKTEDNCGPNPDCYCNTAAERCRSASVDFGGF